MNHAGVKSSIDSSRMFNAPYAEIPSGALGTWGCPGSVGGRVHLSPSPSICLTDSFVSLCLPLFGPGCLPAWTLVTALWGGGVHLSPFVSLHLLSLDAWHGICHPLSPFICLPLPPSLDAWHGSLGGRVHLSPFVSLHLSGALGCFPSFVSRCLPAWMSGTALQADRFTCLPLSPFVSLHLSPVVSQPGCLARLFGWTVSLVSLCLPSFGSRLSPSLDVCHGSPGGRIHLSPLVPLHLSPISVMDCGWTD